MENKETLLKVEGLKKYFKTSRGMLHAVDDVNFSIGYGQTLGVVGESGCGKSTLGRVIIGLLSATSGKVWFDGRQIANEKSNLQRCKQMQIIFQDPYSSFNPRMSVRDTIAEPLRIHSICKTRGELDHRVQELMDTVGLARRFAYSYPHELDGGRRQRIGIARALALEPKFIVCDEPVSALDVSIQAQILNLMQDLQAEKGFTYMFITHDLSVVKHISNEIMVMYLGVMVEKSESDELFDRPLHPYTQALLSAIPEPKVVKTRTRKILQGEITSPVNPKPGCRFAARCEFATDKCHCVSPELEEIFPGHMVACHRVREVNKL